MDGNDRSIYEKQNTILSRPTITTHFHFFPHTSPYHLVHPSKKQKKWTFCVIPEQKKCITKENFLHFHSPHAFHSSYPSVNEISFLTSVLSWNKRNQHAEQLFQHQSQLVPHLVFHLPLAFILTPPPTASPLGKYAPLFIGLNSPQIISNKFRVLEVLLQCDV